MPKSNGENADEVLVGARAIPSLLRVRLWQIPQLSQLAALNAATRMASVTAPPPGGSPAITEQDRTTLAAAASAMPIVRIEPPRGWLDFAWRSCGNTAFNHHFTPPAECARRWTCVLSGVPLTQ